MGGMFGFFAAFKLTMLVLRIMAWLVVTVWLGFVGVCRGARYLWRLRLATREELHCPRGHEVAAFGVTECEGCRAIAEGWLFEKCGYCGSAPAWVACPVCQVAIRHPVRW